MKPLKTLKDIGEGYESRQSMREKLKAEAIKHIQAPGHLVEPSDTKVINWIKYFFNITEEDLE